MTDDLEARVAALEEQLERQRGVYEGYKQQVVKPRLNKLAAARDDLTGEGSELEDVSIEQYREEFEAIADSGDALAEIVASIAPSIHGYDHIKETIAYQMFGGIRKELPNFSTTVLNRRRRPIGIR